MRQKQGVDRTPAYLQRFVCILYICSADEYKMLLILARQSFYLICYLPSAMTGNYIRVTILLVFAVSLLCLCFHRVCVRSVKVCPDDVTTLRGTSPSMLPYFAKKSLDIIFVYCDFHYNFSGCLPCIIGIQFEDGSTLIIGVTVVFIVVWCMEVD